MVDNYREAGEDEELHAAPDSSARPPPPPPSSSSNDTSVPSGVPLGQSSGDEGPPLPFRMDEAWDRRSSSSSSSSSEDEADETNGKAKPLNKAAPASDAPAVAREFSGAVLLCSRHVRPLCPALVPCVYLSVCDSSSVSVCITLKSNCFVHVAAFLFL